MRRRLRQKYPSVGSSCCKDLRYEVVMFYCNATPSGTMPLELQLLRDELVASVLLQCLLMPYALNFMVLC